MELWNFAIVQFSEYSFYFPPPKPPKGGCGESAFPHTPRKSLRFGIAQKMILYQSSASLRSTFASFHLGLWSFFG